MHSGDRLMFGRLGKLLLVALFTELGGSLIRAGAGWIDRKLAPPSPSAEALAPTPEGSLVTDADGSVIASNAGGEEATKTTPEAPLQQP